MKEKIRSQEPRIAVEKLKEARSFLYREVGLRLAWYVVIRPLLSLVPDPDKEPLNDMNNRELWRNK